MPSRRRFLQAVTGGIPVLSLIARRLLAVDSESKTALDELPTQARIRDVTTAVVSAGAHTPYVYVRIHTDLGVTGLGEATLEYKPEAVVGAIQDVRPFLKGKDATQIEHLWQAIYRLSFYRGGPVLNSALGGIDMALWDLRGKLLTEPIYKLLGGPTRTKIRVYTHFGGDTPEEFAENARKKVDEGFRALKSGPGGVFEMVEGPRAIHQIVKKFQAAREAVGDEVDLMFDAHGDLYPAVAAQVAKELEPLHLLFLEEPTLPENADAMERIARETTLPVATGERLYTVWGFREVLEKGIADVIQPDMVHAGGISQLKKIAGMAEAYYVAVAPHNPLSPVATAACLHLDAAIPNFLIQEVVTGNREQRRELVTRDIEKPRDGYVELPPGPGLGLELDRDGLEKYPYEPQGFPLQYRRDGSVGEN